MHRRGNYITIFSSQADLIDRFSFDYAQVPLRKMLACDPLLVESVLHFSYGQQINRKI